MGDASRVTVSAAEWPRDEAVAVRLLRHYLDFLRHNPAGAVNVCMAGYEEELRSLAARYAEPVAALLLAYRDDEALGCVVIKQRPDRPGSCEMKRLWTEPSGRGSGAGRALVEACIQWSRAHGAQTVLLDTVEAAMPDAVRLYRKLGFVETERHNDNPVDGLVFMELHLG